LSKPQPDATTELSLTPLELFDRIAALVPPPRVHRDRYHGVLVPNSPLRAQVTAFAQERIEKTASTTDADETDGPDSLSRSSARYLWTTLIARLFERFPQTFRYGISTQAEGPLCRRFQTFTDNIRYVRLWPVSDLSGRRCRSAPYAAPQ